MDKEEFRTLWRQILGELGISEREAAKILGATQQNINQKVNSGTLRFLDVQNVLEQYGKTLTVEKKSDS